MKNNSMEFLKKVGAFTGIALGAFVLSALAWTAPTDAPPNGNVKPPLNTSNTHQIKDGSLSVNASGIDVYGLDVLRNIRVMGNIEVGDFTNNTGTAGTIRIQDGTQGDGKVLTSDANGFASWKTPTSNNGSSGDKVDVSDIFTATGSGNPESIIMGAYNAYSACFLTGSTFYGTTDGYEEYCRITTGAAGNPSTPWKLEAKRGTCTAVCLTIR
jgi:hypothetical protein